MKKTLPKKLPILPRYERDFSEVKPEHLNICFYYELGRSSNYFKEKVRKWRDSHKKFIEGAKHFLDFKGPLPKLEKLGSESNPLPRRGAEQRAVIKALNNWLRPHMKGGSAFPLDELLCFSTNDKVHNEPYNFLYYFPLFPELAWQQLSERQMELCSHFFARECAPPFPTPAEKSTDDEKFSLELFKKIEPYDYIPNEAVTLDRVPQLEFRQFVEQSALIERHDFPPPSAFSTLEKNDTILRMGDYSHERVHFIVNWAQSDSAIIEALRNWLTSPGRRPKPEFVDWKEWKLRSVLKKLGAYRILQQEGMTPEKAPEYYTNPNEKEPIFYVNPKQYYEAKKDVPEILRNLFSISDK